MGGFAALLRLVALGVMIAAFAGEAAAEKRVALVIGNSTYTAPLRSLKNPVNDATDIAEALTKLGFEVLKGVELDQAGMNSLITRFTEQAREADVSLFYYAGHGFQVNAKNYLVPVDAVLRAREDVPRRTIDLRAMLKGFEGTKGTHLVFLDACRNDPLGGKGGELETSPGLTRVGNAAGFYIAFATQPDNWAWDGVRRNSYFTEAVLSHIGSPGQDIASMMIAVRKDVIAATGGAQRPFEESSIDQQFYFAPGARKVDPEVRLWQLAAADRDQDLLRIYLQRFPEGPHVKEVQRLMQTADGGKAGGAVRGAPQPGAELEGKLWDVAQDVRVPGLYDYYLRRFPGGRYADEARRVLRTFAKPEIGEEAPEAICERLATHPRDETANNPGTSLADLAQNANVAIEACGRAAAQNRSMPQYVALLARALTAAGRLEEALPHFRDAASRGNLRALVTMGLLSETGQGVPRDPSAALSYYEKAADGGSPDGAINLAVALLEGRVTKRDVPRALALLTRASEAGSAIATYNLGVLAQDGIGGTPTTAMDHFKKAASLRDPRAFRAAAVLLDEGRGVPKDPSGAAEYLLQGIVSDAGETLNELQTRAGWSKDTIRMVQTRLRAAGFYSGPTDGRSNPTLNAALRRWRDAGSLDRLQRS